MTRVDIVYYEKTKELCIFKNGYIQLRYFKVENQKEMKDFLYYLDEIANIINKDVTVKARVSEGKI